MARPVFNAQSASKQSSHLSFAVTMASGKRHQNRFGKIVGGAQEPSFIITSSPVSGS